MERVDCVVLGAGVVGLAVARELALRGREPLIIDAAAVIGSGTSSRNSEVIHAGLYYPNDSLKARSCVAGREALYAFCDERGVEVRRTGKLVIAERAEQLDSLQVLAANAANNGVSGLRILNEADATALEPALSCVGALYSPSTGIVDSHGFMLALQGEAESCGAMTVLNTRVTGGRVGASGVELDFAGGLTLQTTVCVNALGLGACAFARAMGEAFAAHTPTPFLAKGSYFGLTVPSPFSHLIYPLPEPGGLGVHITLDLGGRARFGPDVEWIETENYDVDPIRCQSFYDRIRSYWPAMPDDSLVPDYAGIRPKISGPGEAARDFCISGPRQHGVSGMVHMFGIESPGLTASMALAAEVADQLGIGAGQVVD